MEFTYPDSKRAKDLLVKELVSQRDRFETLMSLYLKEEVGDRYGWALTYAIELRPQWADAFQRDIIATLLSTKNDATKRNLLRSLQFVQVREDLEGELLELCYQFLRSEKEKIATRVFSITVIHRVIMKYPELHYELESTLQQLMEFGTAGFKSRARKVIRSLNKAKRTSTDSI